MNNPVKFVPFDVHIPNLEGDGAAEIVPVLIPVTIDPHTGEELLTPEAMELIENTKARHMGLLLPGEIRKMREELGLTQKEMSTLLQAGEKSYTRWESGRARPSRMVNVLLRLVYEGKVFVSDLKSQQEQGINWREKVVYEPQMGEPCRVTPLHFQNPKWEKYPNTESHENLSLAA